jgi:hypothetical protein
MNKYIAYYKRNADFTEVPKTISANYFFSAWVPVEVMAADSLDDVYRNMQGDVWSPNGEMRDFIKILKLTHTSMSVGDVVYSITEDKFYCVNNIGFSELRLTRPI